MANSNGWGDGAANNSIGWGQGANNNIGWGSSYATSWAGLTDIVGIDADAQAFITAAAITDAVQINAINTLVEGMKTDGTWTKMKAIYPFVGGTATTHKWNLKDPRDLDAAFRLVFNGGWTHSSNGATPNGTNGYADTKLVPSSVLTLNSTHLSFYSRTNQATATNAEMGAFDTSLGVPAALLAIKSNSIASGDFYDLRHFYLNDSNLKTTAPTNTQGYAINTKSSSSTTKGFWNNSLLASVTSTNSLTNKAIFIGSRNADGTANNFSAKQCAFSTIGDGLTDTEARVQAFQTSLSRQV